MRQDPGTSSAPAQGDARGEQHSVVTDGSDTVAPANASASSDGSVGASWDLMGLLQEFRAARQRRDESPLGSDEWDIAESEIVHLQRQIFDLTPDDPMHLAGGHAWIDASGSDDDGLDPDAEPGHVEPPSAL
jgi:hypothetical protein